METGLNFFLFISFNPIAHGALALHCREELAF